MSNTKKVVSLIREIVKQEVQKEVKKILISEGAKAISNNINDVPEVLSKPVPKKSEVKEVSYTKDPTLNKILNETAQNDEFAEYPTMGGGTFDSSRAAELLGYGGAGFGNDKETARNVAAVQTMKEAGVSSEQLPDSVVNALTKDYSALMKHDKMKSKR